jgi:hypothetical protein
LISCSNPRWSILIKTRRCQAVIDPHLKVFARF